jgi:hypothetical protein
MTDAGYTAKACEQNLQAKSANPDAREQNLQARSVNPDDREHILQAKSAKTGARERELQTVSGKGAPACEQSQTASGKDDYDDKVWLLRTAFGQLSGAWAPGDGERFPWVFDELDALDRELDSLSKRELALRLRHLYKRLAYAKGRRGHKSGLAASPVGQASTGKSENANANANAQGDDNMGAVVEVPRDVLVARGEYVARIAAIGEPEKSKFDANKLSVRFTFEITEGKYKGARLAKYYTASFNKGSALTALYRRLFGEPKPGDKIDLDCFLNKDVSIVVKHKEGSDGPFAVVDDVFALEELPAN